MKGNFLFRTILLILIAALCIYLSSCSGSRHVLKSSSSVDSTLTVKTKIQKDSAVQQSTVSKTEETTENDITTKDDYVETTTYIYGKDSNNMPTTTKTISRTGTKITKDNSKKKTELNAKADTKSNFTENKKENTEKKGKAEASNKKADSEFSISGGTLFIGIGVVLGMCLVIYIVYKKAKRKVK